MPSSVPHNPRRALLVSSVLPWPLHRNGGAQRTDLLRQALGSAGYSVDVLAAIPAGDSDLPSQDELFDNGVVAAFGVDFMLPSAARSGGLGLLASPLRARRLMKHRYAPHPVVSRWIAQHLDEYDLVVARYLQTALLCALDRRNPVDPPPVWVDLDDLDWLTLADRLRAQPWPGAMGQLGMAAALSANCGVIELPKPLNRLASQDMLDEALCWGFAIRLARRLGAGSARSLRNTALGISGKKLVLYLGESHADLWAEHVETDLVSLAACLGLKPVHKIVPNDVLLEKTSDEVPELEG